MAKFVAISGTSRPDNFTHRALGVVCQALRKRGVELEVFDARSMTLSFPGSPATDDAKRLEDAVREATAVVLATPEYHGSFSAMTKLILENMGFPSALKSKPVALVGVAQGRIGAIKSLEQLRGVCSHMGAIVVPQAVSIAGVQTAFEGDELVDQAVRRALEGSAEALFQFVQSYVCPKYELEAMVRGETTSAWTSNV